MPGKVVCIANRKGGVGKTTLAVVLAQASQALGRQKTLVIDVDPQASATWALAGDDLYSTIRDHFSVTRFFKQKSSPEKFVWGQISALTDSLQTSLALIGSSPDLWKLEERFERHFIKGQWDRLIHWAKASHDIVIVDTPPGRSKLGIWALRSADIILAPCDPTPVSIEAMKLLHEDLGRGRMPRAMKDQCFLVWTKFPTEPGALENFEKTRKELAKQPHVPQMLKEGADTDPDTGAHTGLPNLPAFAKSLNETRGMSFDERYPRTAGKRAAAVWRAMARRLEIGGLDVPQ